MIEGGDDLRSLRPPDPSDWAVQYDPYGPGSTIGNHRGSYEALNVGNPRPNARYYWATDDSRNQSEILRKLNSGWEIVQNDDPELFGAKRLPEGVQKWTGGPRAFQDVILMRINQSEYDRQQAERLAVYRERFRGIIAGEELLEKGEALASQMRGNTSGAPIYVRRPSHGMAVEDL